uniref:Uncharacterized protein n=1 Tax=Rhizophora mucronata TaxID=61149 RepID=A0A2P2PFP1_RHIMU
MVKVELRSFPSGNSAQHPNYSSHRMRQNSFKYRETRRRFMSSFFASNSA